MIDSKISIDNVLLGNYIKYVNMKTLTEKAFKGSDATEVNIYIDMYQMTLDLYRGVRVENYSVVASSMINLCAHIRSYYRTRHGVETKIFIVNSNNMSRSNTNFITDYNKKNKDKVSANKLIWDMINGNIDLLKTLCPYLPDIHFINGTFEPGVIIFDLICKEELKGNFNPNIIFSKSIYNYQIPALHGNTVIFRNKKTKDGDENPRLITNSNAIQEYILETRYKSKEESLSDIYDIHYMSSELLSLLISLTNLPSRNITSLFNIKTAVNILNSALGSGVLFNGYNSDIENIFWQLKNIKPMPVDMKILSNRFNCIDLRYQHIVYMDSAESKDESYLLDLYDDNTVMAINARYFKTNPLDLERL